MRPRPVVGKAAVPDAVRRLMDKFDYPDRETPAQVVPILPTLGGGAGTGAYIHLTRAATQSIGNTGDLISWDTLGTQGVSGFTAAVPTTTVTIQQAGYYNIAVQLGWSSFTEGGTITILKNGVLAWPPTDDPGLWSTTDGQFFEGTAHGIDCLSGDTLSVNINPDDASAQTLASATLAVYLVDRAVAEGLYRELVLSHGPIGYWRLGESSGTNAADETGSNDGTYAGGPSLGNTGVMRDGSDDTSVVFDGGDSAGVGDIAIFDFDGTKSFTVEAWVNATSGTSNNRGFVVKAWAFSPSDHDGWSFFRAGDDITFTRFNRAVEHTVTDPSVTEDADHHVVATYDGTTLILYVDGVLSDSDATALSITAHASPLRIGIGDSGGSPSTGMIGAVDEVAIYDYVLTAAQVADHFAVGRQRW